MNPDLWARIDRVLDECDARQLPPLPSVSAMFGGYTAVPPLPPVDTVEASPPAKRRRRLWPWSRP